MVIIAICSLVLLAYIFDLSAKKTKIPSVILLLILGWVLRKAMQSLNVQLPSLGGVLPVIGTLGLILIVLEGALELELDRSKIKFIGSAFTMALVPMLTFAFGAALLFYGLGIAPFQQALMNIIPLSVISSSIAIPSSNTLPVNDREFITYESSFSDILGILFFNFIVLNPVITIVAYEKFALEIILMVVISLFSTVGLGVLLSRIEHHVKLVPIVLIIILLYAVAKEYHLPALLFILIFGMFLGNLDRLRHSQWLQRFFFRYFKQDEGRWSNLRHEIFRLKEMVTEGAFFVRAIFFILFGYLIKSAELLNVETLKWSLLMVIFIYSARALQLKISKKPIRPLIFMAPRGLINVLLFLSIDPENVLPFMGKSLVIQVVVLSSIVMMVGVMTTQAAQENQTTA